MKTILFALLVAASCLEGQAVNTAVPAIEVASVKPTSWQSQVLFERMSKVANGCPRILPMITGNRLTLSNAAICALVRRAYDIEPYQIVGAPKWFRANADPTIYFDIKLQAPEGTVITQEQAKLMLRALLSDRFRLVTHSEAREMPVYELVVDKGGAKLSETSVVCDSSKLKIRGRLLANCSPTSTTILLASTLSLELDRPVIDRTGVSNRFAYQLVFSSADATPGLDSAPELFTAIREQLGLKLESSKGDVRVLVIDTVERPTEN